MRLIRSVSVRTRLLVALLFVSVLPAVFVGIYAYQTYTRSIVDKLTSSAMQGIHQLDNTFLTELARYTSFIDQVSVPDTVQKALQNHQGGLVLKNEVETLLLRGNYFYNLWVLDIDGVPLYDDGRIVVSTDEIDALLQNADEATTMDNLYFVSSSRVSCLTVGRKIYRYPLGQEQIGYVFVFINDAILNRQLLNGVLQGGDVMLLSANGTVLAGSMADRGARLGETELYARMLQSRSSSFITDLDGVPSLIVFSYNSHYDSYLMAAVPMSFIHEETSRIGLRMVLFVLAVAVLCIALSLWIYRSVATPINDIIAKCRGASEAGNLPEDNSPDELGLLSRTIDKYTADLETMTRMRILDQSRKRELELEALQYQINPHFLFNTLGTLKWVSIINDAPAVISEGITSLSELLRTVLLSKEEMIPVREELDNLAHYFTIQKIRYEECFEVINEIDEAVEDRKIPRFILQPLAENAILHGSEGGKQKIAITVRCAPVPEGVLLEIRDDGNGFDPELVQKHPREKFSGIGLSNVDERLRLYFGNEYGLTIQSRPGEGTTCRMVIPEAFPEDAHEDQI